MSFDFSEKEHFDEIYESLDFSSSTLTGFDLDSVTFIDCDFSNTFLNSCKLRQCTFVKSVLTVLKTTNSTFSEVTFSECKVTGVDWTQAYWPGFLSGAPLTFDCCDISDSTFFGLTLEDLSIQKSRAWDVDFREGTFEGSCFTETDLQGALFHHTGLARADLQRRAITTSVS